MEKIPDNNTIICNLEEFKTLLETQRVYSYDIQMQIDQLKKKYEKKDKKYQLLKQEYSSLLLKNKQQADEIILLKSQIELYNRIIITNPIHYVNQNNYVQMNTNTEIQIRPPPPPPPPPILKTINIENKNNNSIMDQLISELKRKIKPID